MFGTIIQYGKATLRELNTVYTLEDAFDLFEVIAVNAMNEYLAFKEAKAKGGK
jgi:hypothetical protein